MLPGHPSGTEEGTASIHKGVSAQRRVSEALGMESSWKERSIPRFSVTLVTTLCVLGVTSVFFALATFSDLLLPSSPPD